jgi:hypothetical protein
MQAGTEYARAARAAPAALGLSTADWNLAIR